MTREEREQRQREEGQNGRRRTLRHAHELILIKSSPRLVI